MFQLMKLAFYLALLAMFACSLSLVWDDAVTHQPSGAVIGGEAARLYTPKYDARPKP